MTTTQHNIHPLIEAHLNQLTASERKIADYFLHHCQHHHNLNASSIAKRLNTSEATLTRFAKKCGFSGYRTFAYAYQAPNKSQPNDQHIAPVLASYQELLNKTHAIINLPQIRRITALMNQQKRVYIYGKGSSGMVAQEMKLRFMRVGLICEAIVEDDLIRINEVMLDSDCLVIGISISGQSKIITNALQAAKQNNAKTILFTANKRPEFQHYCDEIQLFAMKNQLDNGRHISPQFPALIVLDIVYAEFMQHHPKQRDAIWQRTYQALQQSKEPS